MSQLQDSSAPAQRGIRFSVPLIPQRTLNTCWLAGIRMIVAHAVSAGRLPSPSAARLNDPAVIRGLENLNAILPTARYRSVVAEFGLRCAPLGPPSAAVEGPLLFMEALFRNGPFFYSGLVRGGRNVGGSELHGVVITGVEDEVIFCNDPWPPHRGALRAEPLDELLSELRDVSAPVIFL